jgi:hypothetical protein
VRRLTTTQARYIKTFYGDTILHQLEALEHRNHPHRAHGPAHGPHAPAHEHQKEAAAE